MNSNSKKGKKHLGNPVLKFILTVNYLYHLVKAFQIFYQPKKYLTTPPQLPKCINIKQL